MDFSPLDRELGIWEGGWSEGVVKQAVWLAGRESYQEAEETLSRIGGVFMSASSIRRTTNRWAARLCRWHEQEEARANAMPSRDEPQRGEMKHDTRMVVSIDGWMINIIDEGWKEVKSGTVYEVRMGEGEDELTGEIVEMAQAEACTYVAHLGNAEEFGHKLWTEAVRRRVPAAYEKACIGDAAHWIWNLCEDYFPEAKQTVDWYHAKQHLYAAAHLLHGEGTEKGSVAKNIRSR